MKLVNLKQDPGSAQFGIAFAREDLIQCDPSLIAKFRATDEHAPISKRLHLLACWALSIENERAMIASSTPSDKSVTRRYRQK